MPKLVNISSTRTYNVGGETRYRSTQHGTRFLKLFDTPDGQDIVLTQEVINQLQPGMTLFDACKLAGMGDYLGEDVIESMPAPSGGIWRLRAWFRTPRPVQSAAPQQAPEPVPMSLEDAVA